MAQEINFGNLTIPAVKGKDGDKGKSAIIKEIRVKKLEITECPTARNIGDENEAIIELGIPQNDTISECLISEDYELILKLKSGNEISAGYLRFIKNILVEEGKLSFEMTDGSFVTAGNIYDDALIKTQIKQIQDTFEKKLKELQDEAERLKEDIGTADIKVDSELSETSTNPVQNKVIAEELKKKIEEADLENYVKKTETEEILQSSQTISEIKGNAENISDIANEALSIAKGANQALSYNDYSEMITIFNSLANDKYKIGQNLMIVTLNVPDLWISNISDTSTEYTYVNDETFVNALKETGTIQIGYYILSPLETQKVDLTEYVKNTDYPTETVGGVVKLNGYYGLGQLNGSFFPGTVSVERYKNVINNFFMSKGTLENIKKNYVKEGITNNDIQLTSEEKNQALNWLGVTELVGDINTLLEDLDTGSGV